MPWYKIAQAEKKPYRIYKVGRGRDEEIIFLGIIWAYTSEQARLFALKKSSALKEFVDFCLGSNSDCDVQARVDMGKLQEVRRQQGADSKRKEQQVQEAWWNK